MPWSGNTKPTTSDLFQAYLNRIWRPQLSVTGADGLPSTQIAGNVLRPETTVKLSLRIPPTLEPVQAEKDFIRVINLILFMFLTFIFWRYIKGNMRKYIKILKSLLIFENWNKNKTKQSKN